ncbi:MAG TPA: asparagine synthase (glutamine-hydrolyzing), partial [Elusimicrobiota bacterium]|nr:asparagine synthase (glutamine-hydrolyzing) [Elusimicrobiota bacterium]
MCGICGVVLPTEERLPDGLIERMARTMRHRGPDDEGFASLSGVALGFERLAVLDAAGGRQPMRSEDGSAILVFNGEIFNHRILRQTLESTGRHRFQTRSDTEVLLHAYLEYGPDCLRHLRGMFAFAIWDTRDRTLFAARDRLGKKPFFYTRADGQFIFASELRSVLTHPNVSRNLNYRAIDSYLTYQYIPSPETIFTNISKLPPGSRLIYRDGHVQEQTYWEPSFWPKTELTFDEAVVEFRASLRRATEWRLQADVDVGAFLSGGK